MLETLNHRQGVSQSFECLAPLNHTYVASTLQPASFMPGYISIIPGAVSNLTLSLFHHSSIFYVCFVFPVK